MHPFQICASTSVPVTGHLRNVFLQGSATTLNPRSAAVLLCLHNLHTLKSQLNTNCTTESLLIKAPNTKIDKYIFVEHVVRHKQLRELTTINQFL